MIYALDTNTLTYLLKEDERVHRRADGATRRGDTLILPPIVDYEVQRGLLARRMRKKLIQYHNFRQTLAIGIFDEAVWVRAAHIYAALSQQGKPIDEADIFIAAFCLENVYTLVTNNTRHFQLIDGLAFVNWKE